MAVITFEGMTLTGDHASRPAATAVGSGTLYSCTDHDLIYQSDGATWATWATLGSTGAADIDTATTAETDDTLVLAPDGAGGVEWVTPTAGGGGWDLVVDEDGTTFTNFTSISGTWASTGSIIQNTDGSGEKFCYYNVKQATALMIVQCEVRFPSAEAGTSFVGVTMGGTIGAPNLSVMISRTTTNINVNRVGTAILKTITNPTTFVNDVWYTLRVLLSGNSCSVWIDTLFASSVVNMAMTPSEDGARVGLGTDSSQGDYRNFKVWTPTMPA